MVEGLAPGRGTEPLLEDVMEITLGGSVISKADWVIIGSQTKPYNPPKIEWVQALNGSTEVFRNEVRSLGHSKGGIDASPETHSDELMWFHLVEGADEAGVPVFLKDNLKPLLGDNLRQEMPAS